MRERMPEDEDRRLEALFRPAAAPVADDGFSGRVVQRVAARVWRRRLLLAAAGGAGFAIAGQPAWALAGALGQQLAQLGGRWPELASLLQEPMVMVAGLLLIAGPGLLQWLEG